MSCSKCYRPIDKKCYFFSCTLFHKLPDFTVKLMNMEYGQLNNHSALCIRKFCMCYILNEQFELFLELYKKKIRWEVNIIFFFWLSVVKI